MTNLQDASDAIPAKHVFFVMDACYSGLALTRGGGGAASGDRRQYLMEITRRSAREVLTAGGGDEQVADNGPGGHSIFTWTLLQGLEGKADLDGDGAITATELAAYVGPSVSSLSRQTPAFGHLAGSEGGEFVFELKPEDEFLSEESRQLDAEAIQLNGQLERIRKQIEEKRARNEQLKNEIAAATERAARRGAQTTRTPTPTAMPPVAPGGRPRRRGGRSGCGAAARSSAAMSLYREKRYEEAAKVVRARARDAPRARHGDQQPRVHLLQAGRFDDAVTWYRKAIALDPKRAIAYANLGDALAQRGAADARAAYQKFLELQPRSKLAGGIQQKMALLP